MSPSSSASAPASATSVCSSSSVSASSHQDIRYLYEDMLIVHGQALRNLSDRSYTAAAVAMDQYSYQQLVNAEIVGAYNTAGMINTKAYINVELGRNLDESLQAAQWSLLLRDTPVGKAISLTNIGLIQHRQGDLRRARTSMEEALLLHDTCGKMQVYYNLAAVLADVVLQWSPDRGESEKLLWQGYHHLQNSLLAFEMAQCGVKGHLQQHFHFQEAVKKLHHAATHAKARQNIASAREVEQALQRMCPTIL